MSAVDMPAAAANARASRRLDFCNNFYLDGYTLG